MLRNTGASLKELSMARSYNWNITQIVKLDYNSKNKKMSSY